MPCLCSTPRGPFKAGSCTPGPAGSTAGIVGWTGSILVPPRMACPSPARPGKRYFHASKSGAGKTGWRPQLSLPLQLWERPQLFYSFSGLILLFVVITGTRNQAISHADLHAAIALKGKTLGLPRLLSPKVPDIYFQAKAALPRCPSPAPLAVFHTRGTGKEPARTSLVGTAGAALTEPRLFEPLNPP